MGGRHRVLIVDDSPTARQLITAIVAADASLEVVGQAENGEEAVQLAKQLQPDVITMDIQMPLVDGIEATRQIMSDVPRPIVVISAHHDSDVTLSFKALDAGAVTILQKPTGPADPGFTKTAEEIATTVRLMAEVKVVRRRPNSAAPVPRTEAAGESIQTSRVVELLGIAASTGGPKAVAAVVSDLPADLGVPVVVVQHIAPGYQKGFASWLDARSPLSVRLAADGDQLVPGVVLVAPGGSHMGVSRRRRIVLDGADPIKGHRPSATHLFSSMASAYGAGAMAIILTGMGDDGVAGLTELKAAGGVVIAQDEAISVVYGMPGEAAAHGLVDRVAPLHEIAPLAREVIERT